jgi:hypothetical protein
MRDIWIDSVIERRQIVEETSDWPEGAVADLVDRILRAKYGEIDPSVNKATSPGGR